MKNLDLNELLSNFKATNQLLLSIAEKHNILNAVINDDDCILQDIIDNNNSLIDCFKNYQLNDGWISIDDELPEPEQEINYLDQNFAPQNFYLVQLKSGLIDTVYYATICDDCEYIDIFISCTVYVKENRYFVQERGFSEYVIDEVKCWQYLPQPPKEK